MDNSDLVWQEGSSSADELRWSVRQGLNVLMIGSPVVTADLLRRVRADLGLTIREWSCTQGLPPLDGEPTLIMHDVANLNLTQQRELLRWIDDRGTARQVISVTAEPLLPLVERHVFLDRLYYRLNVVTVAPGQMEELSAMSA